MFTFDRIRRVMERHETAKEAQIPLWFSEGLAEHWSGEMDSYGDMIIRDALFARRLVSIAQMHHIYGTYQMYKEGQSICAFMAETYGEDVFELLFENWWRADSFAEILEITTGSSLAKLDRGLAVQRPQAIPPGHLGSGSAQPVRRSYDPLRFQSQAGAAPDVRR